MQRYRDVLFVDFIMQSLLVARSTSHTYMINALNIDQSNMGRRNEDEISVLMLDCRFLLYAIRRATAIKSHLNNFLQLNDR